MTILAQLPLAGVLYFVGVMISGLNGRHLVQTYCLRPENPERVQLVLTLPTCLAPPEGFLVRCSQCSD